MENSFKVFCSKALNLEGHIELVLHKIKPNSILCDIVTKDTTVENIYLHRNIANKLLDNKVSELIIQHMEDGSIWGAITTRW